MCGILRWYSLSIQVAVKTGSSTWLTLCLVSSPCLSCIFCGSTLTSVYILDGPVDCCYFVYCKDGYYTRQLQGIEARTEDKDRIPAFNHA